MRSIALIIMYIIILGNVYSQGFNLLVNNYDNVPANFSTGAPSLSIPIWTASSGSLSLPVYLSYSSNGIRVSEQPGTVGLGWQLTAGGSITQLVRGAVGYHPKFPKISEITDDYLDSVLWGKIDAEPDIYTFNFPGGAGQFYFVAEGYIQTLGQSNLKIKRLIVPESDTTTKDIFKIIDGNGNEYAFESRSKTSYYRSDGKFSDTYTWFLTRVTSPDKLDEINIEYTKDSLLCLGDLFISINDIYTPVSFQRLKTEPYVEQVLIKSITTKNEKVEFDISRIKDAEYGYEPNRPPKIATENGYLISDVTTHKGVLDSISIKDKNDELIKKFKFGYSYTKNRFFLANISEFGTDNTSMPSYSFSYYGQSNLPYTYSISYDYWGYYNNNETESGLLDDASRYPSHAKAGIGMLRQVNYPTGAHSVYEYEPNTYYLPENSQDEWYDNTWLDAINQLINSYEITESTFNLTGPGIRVKRILSYEGADGQEPLITEFGYDDENGSSGRLSYYPVFKYAALVVDNKTSPPTLEEDYVIECSNSFGLEPGFVTYKKVTVYNGGKIEGTGDGRNGKIEYNFQTKAPITIDDAELFMPHGQTFPYPVKYFEKEENGLLLSKQVFDKNNQPKTAEFNEYNSQYNTFFIKGLKAALYKINLYENDIEYLYTSRFYKIKQKRLQLAKTTSRTYIDGNINNYLETVANYSYTRGTETLLVPTEISTTESNGDVLLTRLYYPADFQTDPACLKMLDRNIVSPVIKKETFKNAQQLSGGNTIFGLEVNSGNDTLIVAKQSQLWINGAFETQTWFDVYDLTNGNLLQMHGRDNIPSTTLYAYHGTLPVASIANLSHASTASLIGAGNVALLRDSYNTADIENTLTSLRTLLNNTYPQAYISTGTYKPLVGKLKATDTNGRFVTYGYDEFGRQLWIKDQNGVIKKYNTYNLIK